jgi:hypothetical protein
MEPSNETLPPPHILKRLDGPERVCRCHTYLGIIDVATIASYVSVEPDQTCFNVYRSLTGIQGPRYEDDDEDEQPMGYRGPGMGVGRLGR